MRALRAHLTYANVMATVAVFIALGGASVAAVRLGKDAVKGRNIATGAVGTRAVLDRSLLAKDFKSGQLASAVRGEPGLRGPAGPAGVGGAAGRDGTAVAASINAGPIGVGTLNLATIPFEFRWTQPPGAYDELRGEMTTTIPAACAQNSALDMQVVLDGSEISPDLSVSGDLVSNGPPDTTAVRVHIQPVTGQTSVERQAMPIELPYVAPPPAPTEHLVTIRASRALCAADLQFTSIRMWIVRDRT